MANKTKLTGDSCSALFSLFARIVECSRGGDPDIIRALGLPFDFVQRLENLGPDQMLSVASRYFLDKDPLSIFNIDMSSLERLVSDEIARSGYRDRRSDEYIRLQASKAMMGKFFGMRGGDISTRKAVLNVDRPEVRTKACTLEESNQIFDAWQATKRMPDIVDRYLFTARISGCPLYKVEAFVQSMESVEASLKSAARKKKQSI